MAFDIEGARKAGYSDAEIADYLSQQSKFDTAGARKAGYSDAEIIQHLSAAPNQQPQTRETSWYGVQKVTPQETQAAIDQMHQAGSAQDEAVLRSAAGLGRTILAPVKWIADKIAPPETTVSSLVTGQPKRNQVSSYIDEISSGLKYLDEKNKDSIGYKGTKLLTDIGLTSPVGGVIGKGIGTVAPRLGEAVTTAGMSTGGPVANTLAARAADMGIRMSGGAINGAATAGLIEPSQAKTGAAVGAVVPPTLSAIGEVGKLAGAGLRKLAPAVSQKAAEQAAAEKAANAIGAGNVNQAIGDLQTYYPKGAENIPVSSAGITGSPGLAELEQASRLRVPKNWTDFDLSQSKAVFDNVINATKEADQLGALKGARADNWKEAWAKADSNFKPRVWDKLMGQLGPDLDQALKAPEASNPAVRNVLQAIKDEVMRVGPDFSPAHLQQIRANLSGRANPMAPDAFKSAPRDSQAVRDVIGEIDNILNRSTSGQWQKVLEGYAQDSDAVRAAAAASKVRGSFVDRDTGRVLTRTADTQGDIPVITQAGLTRAMNAARMPQSGDLLLSHDANQRLEATIGALRRQQAVQNLKRTATAGGGSDTVANLFADQAAREMPNKLLQLVDAVKRMGSAKTDAATTRLLQDPNELARVLNLLSARPAAAPVGNALAPLYRAAPAIAADR